MTMTVRGVTLWACVVATLVGCCHTPDRNLTTKPGHRVKESMFYGSWTLDTKRTNAANGDSSDGAVPSGVVKGVLGSIWEFEEDGVLCTNLASGWKAGSWRIVGKDTLIINEGNGEQQYTAHFDVGHLCLKKSDGKTLILERIKEAKSSQ